MVKYHLFLLRVKDGLEVKNLDVEDFYKFQFRKFLLWLFIFSTVSGILSFKEISQSEWLILQYLFYGIWGSWIYNRFRKIGYSYKQVFGNTQNVNKMNIGMAASLIVLTYIASYQVGILFDVPSISGNSAFKFNIREITHINIVDTFTLILVVIVTPIIEEIYFRRILLKRWSLKWGVNKAIIFSAIAFCLLHADLLGKFIFSIILSLLFLRTRSLIAPIVCHSINNFVFIFYPLIFGISVEDSIDNYLNPLVGFIIAFVLVMYLRYSWRNVTKMPPI